MIHGVTSQGGTGALEAERLLTLVRGHWTVENRLHWVRNGPRVMASLRNLAISVLRLAGA